MNYTKKIGLGQISKLVNGNGQYICANVENVCSISLFLLVPSALSGLSLAFEVSNNCDMGADGEPDPSTGTWVALYGQRTSDGIFESTKTFISATLTHQVIFNVANFRAFRVRSTAWTSGACVIFLNRTQSDCQSIYPPGMVSASQLFIQGQVAHDAAISGFPVRTGARALSAAYSTVASGDQADLIATLQGVQVVRPWQIPELEWSYASPASGLVNSTTAVTIKTAAGSGLKNYITGMDFFHESLTNATEFVIRDAAATVIWRTKIPSGVAARQAVTFENPLRSSANALLDITTLTASGAGAVYFNCNGFVAA